MTVDQVRVVYESVSLYKENDDDGDEGEIVSGLVATSMPLDPELIQFTAFDVEAEATVKLVIGANQVREFCERLQEMLRQKNQGGAR